MKSNFAFLQHHDEQLLCLGVLTARYFPSDPNTCLLKLRQLTAIVTGVRPRLLLCDKLYRLKIDRLRLAPEYIVPYLSSLPARFQLEIEASGSSDSMQNIGQDTIRDLVVPVPPRDEQETRYLMDVNGDFGRLVAAVSDQIEKLHEYRSTLITAAVTGQIDVNAHHS